jgi:methylmalonyl-CoA mutase C-terminal domain/subunit
MSTNRQRVLLAKPGLDGHDLGIKIVARALRDAGVEVIYTGLNVTPEEMVNIALDEWVDVVGISFLSGSHMGLTEKIMKLMTEKDLGHIKVMVGGIIPRQDIQKLMDLGVNRVFPPGSPIEEIADYVLSLAHNESGS